ncbi:MAG: alpha/beta fold hydrolase [Rhodospirillaceae bacterium]|nr:alpha/beta fold hydrolase [Rhodospirillaceae bacterium]
MRKAYIDGRFGQMHVRMAGNQAAAKRPLLCFHLSPVSGVIYEKWIDEMGRDRLALAPDTPGYGMSDAPATPPAIADYAAAMGDVADALKLSAFDVMGYHTGSKIAVEIARQRPRQVKHLILMSAPIYTEDDLKRQHIVNSIPDVDSEGHFLTDAWKTLVQFQDKRANLHDTMKQFPDHLRGGEKRGWGHRAAFSYTYPDTIIDVTAPILVFNPDDDLRDYTPRITPYLKNGRVKDLPGWSHQLLDLSTTEMAQMVRAFLDEDRFPD